jgi:hypothetical protein
MERIGWERSGGDRRGTVLLNLSKIKLDRMFCF